MNATRVFVVAGAAAVAIAAFAVSSVSLYALAVFGGIPDVYALPAGVPIAVDLGTAVGATAWITEREGTKARWWGRVLAIGALALSIVGNVLSHAHATGVFRETWAPVLFVGLAIPSMLAGSFHLASLMVARSTAKVPLRTPAKAAVASKSSPKADPTPKAGAPELVEPKTETARVHDLGPVRTKAEQAKRYLQANPTASYSEVQAAVGCGAGAVAKAREWLKEQESKEQLA